MTSLFLDRHHDLRSGWRILLFLAIAGIVGLGLVFLASWAGVYTDPGARLLLLIGVLAATYGMTRFVNRKPFAAAGFALHPGMFVELGMGCLVGCVMMAAIYGVEYVSGFVSLSWRGMSAGDALLTLGASVVWFAVAAALEEALFRGYVFQTLMQGITFLPAAVVMSALFALAHTGNRSVTALGLLNIGLAGLWLSFAYLKTRSLWLPFGLHFAWNFSQTTLFSFPTSGGPFEHLRLFDMHQAGPAILTGASFGPEGGVLASVALLISTGYILKSELLTAPEGIITLDSLEDLMVPAERGEKGKA